MVTSSIDIQTQPYYPNLTSSVTLLSILSPEPHFSGIIANYMPCQVCLSFTTA
uniref:Uncharacterized protein n=1 Tax=Anguilla anguilla TaxID=7936 RepID=A0A0E9PUQ6_ANGAN